MKLAVVGTGLIVQMFFTMIKETEAIKVAAICSRKGSIDKAKKFAEEFNISKVYDDYDLLLQDEEIDTVYIGLLNSLHYPYAIKALQAGKNVALEKPFTDTYQHAQEIYKLAEEKNLIVMEANRIPYASLPKQLKPYLSQLGKISLVNASFCKVSSRYKDYKEGNIKPAFDPDYSGGALMDLNCYNIIFMATMFGLANKVNYYPNFGVNGIDLSGVAILQYDGLVITSTAGKDDNGKGFCDIQGENGHIYIDSTLGSAKKAIVSIVGQPEVVLTDITDSVSMSTEFKELERLVDEKDLASAKQYSEISLMAMKMIQMAKDDAGIKY